MFPKSRNHARFIHDYRNHASPTSSQCEVSPLESDLCFGSSVCMCAPCAAVRTDIIAPFLSFIIIIVSFAANSVKKKRTYNGSNSTSKASGSKKCKNTNWFVRQFQKFFIEFEVLSVTVIGFGSTALNSSSINAVPTSDPACVMQCTLALWFQCISNR